MTMTRQLVNGKEPAYTSRQAIYDLLESHFGEWLYDDEIAHMVDVRFSSETVRRMLVRMRQRKEIEWRLKDDGSGRPPKVQSMVPWRGYWHD